MTNHLEEIYGQYRQADVTDRLYIYLQYPELRNDFLDIEQKEKQTNRVAPADTHFRFRRRRLPSGLFSLGRKHATR